MGLKISSGVNLRESNSFGFCAVAERYAIASDQTELQQLSQRAQDNNWPLLVLGGGSNLILQPQVPGLVIQLGNRGWSLLETEQDHVLIEVAGGESWHGFVAEMARNGYYGLENLALIPGSVGAAPVQNIGAYGVELADRLVELRVLDRQSGSFISLSCADCGFGYRDSIFKSVVPGRYIIWSLRFRLDRDFTPQLQYRALADAISHSDHSVSAEQVITAERVFDAVVSVRSSKLPDPAEVGNAGSFFENPVVDQQSFSELKRRFPDLVAFEDRPGYMKLAAGWLIDQAGWKGYRCGHAGIGVYEKQALVLVNRGGGDAVQLAELADRIKASVRERFGVELRQEPRIYPADLPG
ncbi:UDP-N-acetylmuramate dehydrogenase [Marinobacterium jannaschii]|uniref:UDP-N-acetylmuramate dehydrogenase n=1 Tax=Marinobacterium jannaschii TaxID=64970 RepID=UPI00048274AC|nr:UDP-N-acetylmuramate dehydrogenase [Marinobacterium jannaschii]